MYKTHNFTTGEFRIFEEWSDVCRYIAKCEDLGQDVTYVKTDCVEVK